MKNRIILKLIVFLLLLPGWLFSQNLEFVQDPANNYYIENDTLIEEVVYCGTSYNYFLNVTGGAQPLTYNWKVTNCIIGPNLTQLSTNAAVNPSLATIVVSDSQGDSIIKKIYFFNAPVLENLPATIENKDTSIILNQRPKSASISGPGIYYNPTIAKYFYRPDSAGVGVHALVISIPNAICSPFPQKTIQYTVTAQPVPELEIVGSPVWQYGVCSNDTLRLSTAATGGQRPYTYNWKGVNIQDCYLENDSTLIFNYPNFNIATGTYQFFCDVTDKTGTFVTKTFYVTVNEVPAFSAPDLPTEVSISDAPIALTNLGINLSVTGDGVVSDNGVYYFDPAIAGIGQHVIEFETFSGNCYAIVRHFITVINDAEPLVIQDSIQNKSVCAFLSDSLIVNTITGGVQPYHYSWESSIGDLSNVDNPRNYIYRTGYFGEIVVVTCTVTDAIGQTAKKVFTFYVDYYINFDKTGIPTSVYNDDPAFLLTDNFKFTLLNKAVEINNTGIYFNPAKADIGSNTVQIRRYNTVCGFKDDSLVIEVIERPQIDSMEITFNPSNTIEICENDSMYHYITATVSGGVAFSDGNYIVRLNGVEVTQATSYEVPVYVGIDDQIIEFEDVYGHIINETISVVTISATQVHLNNIYIEQGKSETVKTYPVNFESYIWSTGSTESEIVVSEAGEYSVSVTDANGCVSSDKANVIVYTCTTTADFVVERVPGTVLGYEFTAQDEADVYYWSIPENISKTGKTFVHEFVNAISGEVCLTVYQGQFCSDTVCKQMSFEPNVNLFSISGQVIGGDNIVGCGTTIAFEEVAGELVARDTTEITPNGYYRHVNLEEGSYTILAKPCDDKFENTYFVNKITPEDATMINLIGDATSVDIYLVEKTSTSIIESNTGSVAVFPCPMIDQSIISIDKVNATNVLFYDMTGKLVLEIIPQSNIIRITKSELPSGTYTLLIKNNQKTIASQLFIVK